MSPENPPAFPVIAENGLGHVGDGMSLRDYFAGQALIGLYADNDCDASSYDVNAASAYEQADAMLSERAKGGAA